MTSKDTSPGAGVPANLGGRPAARGWLARLAATLRPARGKHRAPGRTGLTFGARRDDGRHRPSDGPGGAARPVLP